MDQEKIGKFIKEIRTKEKLSQQKFAEKYGVTYQAVSKWENGKNIPDLAILKQMCSEYHTNLDDFLDSKITNFNRKKKKRILEFGIVFLICIGIFFIINTRAKNEFEFKTISPNCNNFKLYGSIAYNDNKSSIYIPHITYCGGDDHNKYQKMECILYEETGKTKIEISRFHYQGDNPITLEEFLKEVTFQVDHYEKSCKIYKENALRLEIYADQVNGKTITYQIPLKLEDTCD